MARSVSSQPLHDHRALDWLALAATSRVVAKVQHHQLDLPTPCTVWTLQDLLRHMVGNNIGFARAASGAAADPRIWDGADLSEDPRGSWDASVEQVVTAFSELTNPTAPWDIAGYGEVPAAQAVGMHLIDYLTHGWDVAVSIGAPPNLDEESCREVLRMAARWPRGDPAIWGPGAPFGIPVDIPRTAPAVDRMLGLLGRSPTWPESYEAGRNADPEHH
jgi:uncharacterized protein (TIGR03086 family)